MFIYLQNLYYTLTKNEQALLVLKYKKIAKLSQKLYQTKCKNLSWNKSFHIEEKIRKLIIQIDELIIPDDIQSEKMNLTDAQLDDVDFYIDTILFWNKQSKALEDSYKPVYLNDQPV
jgi:hypothetical protein